MSFARAAARRVRRTAVRTLLVLADACDAAAYMWEKSLMAPQAPPYGKP
jgi:hypothetical protein